MLKIAIRTVDRYIGILFIEQHPLVVHFMKTLARNQDNSPRRDVTESPDHFPKGDLQVQDESSR